MACSLYCCDRCGHVRADDTYCRVCGSEHLSEHDVCEWDGGEDEGHVCEHCGETFETAQGLSSHRRSKHD